MITSVNNPLVKHLVKLRESRSYRKQKSHTIISGRKMVEELSKSHELETLITTAPCSIPAKKHFLVSETALKKITNMKSSDGFIAEIAIPKWADLSQKKRIVILDQINIPGNMGTLLRTALALGYEGVFITEGSCDPFSDKALRASKGAAFHMPLQWGNFESLNFSGTVYLADLHGEDIQTISFSSPLAIAFGNEAHGFISDLPTQKTKKIAIPISSCIESLNVAAAAAIILYKARYA